MGVEKILNDFGAKVVKELANNLNTYGHNGGKIDASGQLRSSIKFTTVVLGQAYHFTLSMVDYYQWVDEGRKAGKWAGQMPQIYPANLLRWMQTKQTLRSKIGQMGKRNRAGIKGLESITLSDARSLAFLIGRKIKEKGIKPTNFFSDVFNDEALLKLKNNIRVELQRDIKIELTNI